MIFTLHTNNTLSNTIIGYNNFTCLTRAINNDFTQILICLFICWNLERNFVYLKSYSENHECIFSFVPLKNLTSLSKNCFNFINT